MVITAGPDNMLSYLDMPDTSSSLPKVFLGELICCIIK